MSERSIGEIMAAGRKLALEGAELLEKQIEGTITPEESARLREVNAHCLGLMRQAQAKGVGTEAEIPLGSDEDSDEDYDDYYDEYGDEYHEDYSDEEEDDSAEDLENEPMRGTSYYGGGIFGDSR